MEGTPTIKHLISIQNTLITLEMAGILEAVCQEIGVTVICIFYITPICFCMLSVLFHMSTLFILANIFPYIYL
jgi:hypothetical protein